MWRTLALASVSAIALAAALPADAAVKAKLEAVATGLTAPLAMVQPNGDDRKFIIEQDGRVRILTKDGELLDEPFLDIRHKLEPLWSDFDEKGLLGIAFHPKFKENGRFYIAYSAPISFENDLAKQFWWSHTNIVAEYRVSADDPNKADPNYEKIIRGDDWPQFNHNGHWMGFGPDGMLYISMGDGGYANDWGIGHNVTEGNGQDLTTPLGKILRIDVDGGDPYGIPADNPFVGDMNALPEIWASGLRNPWRCSFDMGGDHRLFCGDVQQNSYEEVDIIVKGGNYGWRRMEASHCFDYVNPNDHPADCDKTGLILPILEYRNCTARPEGCLGISVTGGYVYRGSYEPWQGKYIFGDWSKTFARRNGQLFIATENADGTWSMDHIEVTNMDGPLPYVLAFAQDAEGEVYVLTSLTTGPVGGLDTIYKIVPAE
jgi:glucose/arabinose dehydrogenase